jgi:hypothetical protein
MLMRATAALNARPNLSELEIGLGRDLLDVWWQTRSNHRANEVNDLNVQNRGDYFSAIFGVALGGRPRLTPHNRRKALRR